MKKILVIAMFIAGFSFSADAQFKFGAGVQLLDFESFGVGAKGHYTINDQFAVQGSFHWQLEEFTSWTFDADVHYQGFDLGDVEGFQLSPFAGLNRVQVSAFGVSVGDTNINLGMNGTLPLSGSMSLYLEPKIILGGGSAFVIGAGVYF